MQQPDPQGGETPIPFGAMELPLGHASSGEPRRDGQPDGSKKDWRKPENRRGSARRGGRRRNRRPHEVQPQAAPGDNGALAPAGEIGSQERHAPAGPAGGAGPRPGGAGAGGGSAGGADDGGSRRARRRRRRRWQQGGEDREGQGGGSVATEQAPVQHGRRQERPRPPDQRESVAVEGMVVLEKGGFGFLRWEANQFLPSRDDAWIPQHLVQRHKLRDGSLVSGKALRAKGPNKLHLASVELVDGRDPREVQDLTAFKSLTSIDPDFHYAVGDESGDVSMRILDVVCPVGRGTRGLIVAPPRSGKTILMRKFAAAIEKTYPEVVLMVLLVDERPEEATEWRRSTGGQVFVSTNDESAKNHVQLAEAVWKRCTRLVELGQDVILLLDSITRLARAYNNMEGGSGRTMSGGLDSRAMEKPRGFFGSARNTETAGSLTILGTTLVETGSRLDQLVFEEFKGTGNMECVLSRKLSDRRIFPAIDIERSGTRKEEKLISARRLKQIHTLRRVLLKMNFIEAMELLVHKLEDVEKTDDFLKRFEVDPEA